MEDWTRRGFLAGAGGAIIAVRSAHGQDGTDVDIDTDVELDADTDITEGFDAGSIDDRVAQSLEIMQETHPFTTEFLKQAAGVLIMPLIGKGGIIFSGSYGEGALRIGGQNVDYYTGDWWLYRVSNRRWAVCLGVVLYDGRVFGQIPQSKGLDGWCGFAIYRAG